MPFKVMYCMSYMLIQAPSITHIFDLNCFTGCMTSDSTSAVNPNARCVLIISLYYKRFDVRNDLHWYTVDSFLQKFWRRHLGIHVIPSCKFSQFLAREWLIRIRGTSVWDIFKIIKAAVLTCEVVIAKTALEFCTLKSALVKSLSNILTFCITTYANCMVIDLI